MKQAYLMDVAELYYINDMHRHKKQTGVRWSQGHRDYIKLLMFWYGMQILLLRKLLRYKRLK